MHILIVEPSLSGHHATYLEKIACGFLSVGHQVTIATDYANKKNEFLSPSLCGVTVEYFSWGRGKKSAAMNNVILNELTSRKKMAEIYSYTSAKCPVDFVFLPYLDYCLHAIGLLGSPFAQTPWAGICMRPSFHYSFYEVVAPKPKLALVKRFLFNRLLRIKTLQSVYTIDELLFDYVDANYPQSRLKISYVPDPVDIPAIVSGARTFLNIPNEKFVILVFGSIDDRKGVRELVRTAVGRKDIQILLIGKQSPSVRSFIAGLHLASDAVIVVDRYVSQEEQSLYFSACDTVWLGYKGHYSMSGVLVLASIFKKPVIATKDGLIGWYVSRGTLGFLCDVTNKASIEVAIMKASLAISNGWAPDETTFKYNTWEVFVNEICH